MSNKATPISNLQPQGQQDMGLGQQQLDNLQLEEVIHDLNQSDQQAMYEQPMMMPPQQQQMMMPPQQQMMMPPPPMMMPPPMMPTKSVSVVDKLMAELKDALIVVLVFIIINFEPVSRALDGVFDKVSTSPMVHLVLKGLSAGLIFYAVRKIVLNQ